jgi:hypothetical protein
MLTRHPPFFSVHGMRRQKDWVWNLNESKEITP